MEIRLTRALAIFLLLAGWAASLEATKIYVREDAHGVHYSDRPSPAATPLRVRTGTEYSFVRAVYDGDTLLLDNRAKVRLLGINTPEIESRHQAGEPIGEEARVWLKKALEGKKVHLEKDVEATDHYHRILAHVFTEDRRHINLELVRRGLASVNIHPPNLKYTQMLLAAQRIAEAERRGIWGNPAYRPKPIKALVGSKSRGWQRLLGCPKSLQPSRKYFRLIYSGKVEVKIPRENLDLFPNLTTYLGRDTEIRGWPSRRKEHYSILVLHPSALQLIGKE